MGIGEASAERFYYKGVGAAYKYKTTPGGSYNETSGEWATMTHHAKYSNGTGEVRVRGFGRYETIKAQWGYDYVSKVEGMKMGIADADSNASMWIYTPSPTERSHQYIDTAIWDLLGFSYTTNVVKVLAQGMSAGVDHNWHVDNGTGHSTVSVKMHDTFGLDLSVNADNSYDAWHVEEYAADRAQNGYPTGTTAHFRFDIPQSVYNYTYRTFVSASYTVKSPSGYTFPAYTNNANDYGTVNSR